MFRSNKPLIGTPNDRAKKIKSFEFTPIGYSKNNENIDPKSQTIKKHGNKFHQDTLRGNPFDQSPLENSIRGGSSFIEPESFDTINYSDKNGNNNNKGKTSSPIPNKFDNHNLLNDGSNPVKYQQANVSKLQDENYNLRVEISSLKRFVNACTNNDQQEIYKQNSELQEKMIAMRGELSFLNQELSDARKELEQQNQQQQQIPSNGNNNSDEILQYQNQIMNLQKENENLKQSNEDLYDLENENEELHATIKELQNVHKSEQDNNAISQSFVDRLEEQLETVKDKLYETERELNMRNEELDQYEDKVEEMENLLKTHKNLSDQQQDEIEEELDDLKAIIRKKDEEFAKLQDQYDEVANNAKELRGNYKSIQEEKDKLYALMESKSQESNNKYLENFQKLEDHNRVLLQKIHAKEDDLEKLNQQLSKSNSQIKHLNQTIDSQSQLIEKLRSNNSSNEQVHEFVEDLKNQIIGLEKELQSVSFERDSLQKQLIKSDKEIIALRNNNERTYKAYTDLKKSQSTTKETRHNDTEKLEDIWKSEIDYLSNQIKELNVENKTLSKKLNNKSIDTNSFDKAEVKNLTSKCNDLQLELTEKNNQLTQISFKHKKELAKLNDLLNEKEDELHKANRELKFMQTSTTEQIDNEKLEALKLKNKREYEIKALKIEIEGLKTGHENEIQSYKKLLENLKNSTSSSSSSSIDKKSHDELDILIKKIDDKNLKIKILNNKLSESIDTIHLLEKEINKLESNKFIIIEDNKKLDNKVRKLSHELMNQKKQLDSIYYKVSLDNNNDSQKLQYELSKKEKQLENINIEFNDMKNELLFKYSEIRQDKLNLENKMEKIIKKYRHLQNTLNINEKSNNNFSHNDNNKEYLMIQDQSDLYRMKLNKSNYIINDLKFINSFILKSIQATNSHLKKDVKKLQQAGIYPDYELISNKKPSLKIIFKFVVAAVRIKRKTDYSSIRNKKIEDLKFKLAIDDY
ncbi:Laminin subunit alpha-2 [Wickerhamomyces ciferrii]|uniref:Laminin subunit alpha-2 n=1 Tax=Wickerhamomyces ciferrii (strain ATCC 14091 / BCRC 22168 / CBS 111 / JCM 3599 / NBRC 0793 / NRRL Y-1031 F-60-10) TaxID=1206466 RepID=K0KVJ5_WICCF|nr:Laminin subunit alpha-2 [Wickerhamomyces ciferrii]CCH45489.1 Laminin subunit alpha-2 [Wickerhamomyces ciferrii]